MLIQAVEDVRFLPRGTLLLEFEGEEFIARVDKNYAASAAKCLLDQGVTKDFSSLSELVAAAINDFDWDLGRLSYRAKS